MFEKKNSFILGLLWFVLLVTGTFLYWKFANQLVEAMAHKKELEDQLKHSQEEIGRLKDVRKVHDELSQKWLDAPKIVIAANEPSFSLSYINWLMSSRNLIIDFDFVLNQKRENDGYTEFNYTLTGEATYDAIYKLIWYLTYEPILYKIDFIDLKKGSSSPELLRFTMKLRGYSVESAADLMEDFKEFEPRSVRLASFQHDIFDPLVLPAPRVAAAETKKIEPPRLPPKQPGEIDVEKAKLKAVTSSSVFVSEGGSGLVELKIGDPVYLGNLIRVDLQANEAEFRITKFGVSQNVKLRIEQGN